MLGPTARQRPRPRRCARGAAIAAIAATGALLAALAGPATVAGAAGGGPTQATQLVAQSFAVSSAATSVTVRGTFLDSNKTITLHVTDTKGGTGFGTVKVEGLTIHILQVRGANYFKAGADYWKKILGSNQLGVSLYAGHWVKSSSTETDSPGTVFAAFVNLDTFLGGYNTSGVTWVVKGHKTFEGQRVTVVRGTQKGMTGTLLIAAKGPPYLMAIEPPKGQGDITFSNWNHRVTLRPPARWVAFHPPPSTQSTTTTP